MRGVCLLHSFKLRQSDVIDCSWRGGDLERDEGQ